MEKEQLVKDRSGVYAVVLTGLMTAIVMAATSFFRIPVPATNGYIHLGDAMVFLSVLMLGRRNGTIAAASGSALADLLGGYAHWVPWTFAIKALMALTTSLVLSALTKKPAAENKDGDKAVKQYSPVISAIAMTTGSVVMVSGYFIAHRIIYGNFAAPLAALPGNLIQAAAGIVLAEVLSTAMYKAVPEIMK